MNPDGKTLMSQKFAYIQHKQRLAQTLSEVNEDFFIEEPKISFPARPADSKFWKKINSEGFERRNGLVVKVKE